MSVFPKFRSINSEFHGDEDLCHWNFKKHSVVSGSDDYGHNHQQDMIGRSLSRSSLGSVSSDVMDSLPTSSTSSTSDQHSPQSQFPSSTSDHHSPQSQFPSSTSDHHSPQSQFHTLKNQQHSRSPSSVSNVTSNHSVHFSSSDHVSLAFCSMNQMRKIGLLCDVHLVAGNGGDQIKCHKIVLAATSAYFHAMFSNEWPEKQQALIVLHEIEISALTSLIDYCYTGSIEIDESNVQSLLPAASLLQVSLVREACCSFLLQQLHPNNCLGIRSFADSHSCDQLLRVSNKFALENFSQVSLTDEFLSLPLKQVEDLISSQQLNVANEEVVFEAVMRWIKFDEEREVHLGQLLKHVKLPLTRRSFLLHVSEEPLIQSNEQGKDLLIEAMKYLLSPESRSTMNDNVRTQIRRPEGQTKYIFAIGGGSLFAIHNECEVYNPQVDRWSPIQPTIQRRSRAGVTSLDKFVYAIGGYNGSKDLSSGEYYDPLSNSWQMMTCNMNSRRSCLGVSTLNGLIYVSGGFDGASSLSSVERFDPLIETWSSVAALNTPRRYNRLTVSEGCLFAVGGYDGANYHSSFERFDPREGKWFLMPAMMNRRSSCGVCSSGSGIIVSGGNDGSLCMSSVERFDLRGNAWEPVTSMNSRRSTHELVPVNPNMLYAIGGNDSSSSLNTVEVYNVKENKWTTVNSMTLRRSSVGSTFLECPTLETSFIPLQSSTLNVNLGSNEIYTSGS